MNTADEYLMLSEAVRLLEDILPRPLLDVIERRGVRIIARRAMVRRTAQMAGAVGVKAAAEAQGLSLAGAYKQIHASRKFSTESAHE
jgi:hypothetical protein